MPLTAPAPDHAPLDLVRLREDVAGVVRKAGAIAVAMFRGGAERWTKADDSPVTEADLAVDRFLFERLPAMVERSGWLSEETADTPDRLSRRRVWVVDPIDGTRAFVEGLPEWVVSVALVEDGAPVLGLIYDACRDVMYSATLGGGARRGDDPLAVADSASLEGVTVCAPGTLLGALEGLGYVRAHWIHALANRLVKVAAGDLGAAMARPNANDWDIAAAHLIIEEAGARLTGFDGAAPTYNRTGTRHGGLVAAAPARHATILAALQAERALTPTES